MVDADVDTNSMLYGFSGETPFWLAPLGSLRISDPEAVEKIEADLGWENDRLAWTASLVAGGVLLLIQLRVTWVGLMMTDESGPADP